MQTPQLGIGHGRARLFWLALGAIAATATACGDITVAAGNVDLSCDAYCDEALAQCGSSGGPNSFYADREECMAYCPDAAMATGAPADTSGNSLGCRINHLIQIKNGASAATLCPAASPSGGDVCGSWCTVYCDLVMSTCPGLYADDEACAIACQAFDTSGQPGALTGNTVQCRLYHAFIATIGGDADAVTHCPHAGPDGANVCVDPTP